MRFEMGKAARSTRSFLWHNTRQSARITCHDFKTEEQENGYAKIFRPPEIRQRGVEARRKRDAAEEKGDAQIGKRKNGEEPEAGDCHWPVRSPEEGR